ncbi:MAG: baeRF10 domain-containing protein [Acidimicrobiales bacterium]
MLSKEAIRSLAAFKGDGMPVVSLYLDVDGRRYSHPQQYQKQLAQLLRKVGASAKSNGSSGVPSEDLRRISDHVNADLDRSHTRGLALFSCASKGLWETFELPVPVRNHLMINQAPQVAQLEHLNQEHRCFGVLLVDRQWARMFVVELGQVAESREIFDELPRHEDDKGEWDRDHVHDHQAAAAQHHLRRAAELAFTTFQEHGFDHLILGAASEIASEVERELHSYLRERLASRVTIGINASLADVRQAVLKVEEQVERAMEANLVEGLRERLGTGTAVAGLAPVLEALADRRVSTLIVSHGYAAPGWRCSECRILAAVGRACPVCEGTMDEVEDVVEEAVDAALVLGSRIASCENSADLDVLGRIGALLRF